MKNSFLSLLILVVLSSCSSDDVEPYDISSYYFATESKITVTTEDTNTFANIVSGENLVFKFELYQTEVNDHDMDNVPTYLEDLKDKLDDDDFEEPDIIMLDKALEAAKILSFDDPHFI